MHDKRALKKANFVVQNLKKKLPYIKPVSLMLTVDQLQSSTYRPTFCVQRNFCCYNGKIEPAKHSRQPQNTLNFEEICCTLNKRSEGI